MGLVSKRDQPPFQQLLLTIPYHPLAMAGGLLRLLRREVILPFLSVLVLSAPLSNWPAYSACVLLANHVATLPAHVAFRVYQQKEDSNGSPPSVVNCLMYILSIILQLVEGNAVAVLLFRLLAPEASLLWYQDYSGWVCLALFPRLFTSVADPENFVTDPDPGSEKVRYGSGSNRTLIQIRIQAKTIGTDADPRRIQY